VQSSARVEQLDLLEHGGHVLPLDAGIDPEEPRVALDLLWNTVFQPVLTPVLVCQKYAHRGDYF